MNLLDLGLLVTVVAFAWSGYRQGFIVGALGFAGFLGGGIAALILVPKLVEQWHSGPPGRGVVIAAAAAVVVSAATGQVLCTAVAGGIRRRVVWRPARAIDASLGAAVSVVAVLVVAWFVALALRSSPLASLSKEVRTSLVIRSVGSVMPDNSTTMFASFRSLVHEGPFTDAFSGLTEPIRGVQAPDPHVVDASPIAADAQSIVEVSGPARSCSRQVDGSGFVYAPEHVLTNAHVVAGVSSPRVSAGGTSLPGRVVAFDARRDVAVVYVPGLAAPPLPLTGGAARGNSAVVAGYPGGGPYALGSARIREVLRARGPDIYGKGHVTREVLSLFATVRAGNSGGPLLSTQGAVIGMIFAKSLDDEHTGYALTIGELAPVANPARTWVVPVPTGDCTG